MSYLSLVSLLAGKIPGNAEPVPLAALLTGFEHMGYARGPFGDGWV